MTETAKLANVTVKKPEPGELEKLRVFTWPVWEKETSTFDWHYGEEETCYFLEGEVVVKTADGEISMGKGDLVTFPAGLGCTWEVKQAVRKHYRLG